MKTPSKSTITPKSKRKPPARPASYHHGDLRRALLAAAEIVLEEAGVEGFTLRECARRAGVSHGAPAHHFGDVRGLLSAFTAESFEQLEALTRDYRAAADPAPASQLTAIGVAYVDYALAHRARFRLMFRSERLDREHPPLLEASARLYGHLVECATASSRAAGAGETLIAEKIAIAWTQVHGFATLMLENVRFAEQVAQSPGGVRGFVERISVMTRPAIAATVVL